VRMIGFEGKPVPAKEEEISSLMILNGTDRTVHNRSYMNEGDKVMIMEGPLKGLVGFYLHHKGDTGKVVVSVESEEALLDLERQAKEKNLPCALITVNGWTEFKGVPTITALAIGPADGEVIDTVTGKLPLL
jgi:hypothetical protein